MNHTLKVGDILESNWGYEQTNIDFYQVVKTSNSFVTVREIEKVKEYDTDMTGHSTPVRDSFKGDPIRRKVNNYGYDMIQLENYSMGPVAKLWDGRPQLFTSYA